MMEATTENKVVIEAVGWIGDKSYYAGLTGPIEAAIEDAMDKIFNVDDSIPGASTWDEGPKKLRITIEVLPE